MRYRLIPRAHLAMILFISVCRPDTVLGGNDVDATTSVTVDSRTGLFAALYASNEDEAASAQPTGVVSTQILVTPGLELGLSTGRTTLEMAYQIELSNFVAREEDFRLNVYQQAGLHLVTSLSRTLTFVADAAGRMGLLDYSRALYVFDTEGDIAPNLPETQQLRFYEVNASMGLAKQWSRRASSDFAATFNMRRPFGYDENEAPFPDSYQYRFEVGNLYALTRRDALTLNTSGGLVLYTPGDDFVPIGITTGWRHDFSETATISLAAGVTVAYQLEINQERPQDALDPIYTGNAGRYLLPMGSIAYHHLFNLKGRKTLTIDLSGDVNAYFDNVAASVRQQYLFGIAGALRFQSEWELAVSGTLSYLDTTVPVNSTQGATVPPIEYPTVAALNANAGYPVTPEIQILFGIMSSARWSGFGAEEFRARAFEEFIVYISISATKNHLEP